MLLPGPNKPQRKPPPPSAVESTAKSGADNTAINTRDKSDATLTPQQQTSSKADRKILAAVRRAVVDDNTLSIAAHNVKIITLDGVVTLRGPVDNESEKHKIEKLAKQVAGVARVVNQLDVKTK